ncbi:hypothetical protein SESBI_06693, partial [Sesbania bispinosa]
IEATAMGVQNLNQRSIYLAAGTTRWGRLATNGGGAHSGDFVQWRQRALGGVGAQRRRRSDQN